MKTALAFMVGLLLATILATSLAGDWMASAGIGHDPASTDGRYHQCGLVTEDGVTEELNAYHARCGK